MLPSRSKLGRGEICQRGKLYSSCISRVGMGNGAHDSQPALTLGSLVLQDGAKEGGQRAQVGRKPAGYFSSLADSRSRRPPLRT